MVTTFGIDEQAERVDTGTQDFTDALLGGDDYKGAMVLSTRGVTLGTIADHSEMTTGVCTGATIEQGNSTNSEHDVPTSDTNFRQVDADVCQHMNPGTATAQDKAQPNLAIADGVRLNWSSVNAQYRTLVGMFAGAGIDVAVDRIEEGGGGTGGTFQVTGVGFQPQAVIIFGSGTDGDSSSYRCGVGVAVDNGSGTDQFAMINVSENGVATQDNNGWFTNTGAFKNVGNNSAWSRWELTEWQADGIEITRRDSSGDFRDAIAIFLRSDDWTFVAGQYTIPTSGDITVSGLGITPKFMLDVMTLIETANTFHNGSAQASALSIVLNSATEEFSASVGMTHGATQMVCKSLMKTGAAAMLGDDPTAIDIEGVTTLSIDKWSRDMSNWPESATLGLYIAGGPPFSNKSGIIKQGLFVT